MGGCPSDSPTWVSRLPLTYQRRALERVRDTALPRRCRLLVDLPPAWVVRSL